MNVVGDLQEWLKEQPVWLTEALNRLLTKSELGDKDISDLSEICKRLHGLSEIDIEVTAKTDRRNVDVAHGPVQIKCVHHFKGVNALADNQKIEFGNNLTVVYGDNGAGKSGYTRILKQACKARGTEEILGNVFDISKITKPQIKIEYSVGENSGIIEDWEIKESPLHMINVFDSHCASVYLNEKTDVAFRPFGLDLYDKLSAICERVKGRLDSEISFLESSIFKPPSIPSSTKAAEFLSRLNARTSKDEFENVIKLKPEDLLRLNTIDKMIDEAKKADKLKLKTQLETRKRRIESLKNHLKNIDNILGDPSISTLKDLNQRAVKAKSEVDKLRNTMLDQSLLTGTGSDTWRPLWDAAKNFSEKSAYRELVFPNLITDSKCVLCQQELSDQAVKRFELFSNLVQSVVEKVYEQINREYSAKFGSIKDLVVVDVEIERLLEDLKIESVELADVLEKELKSIVKRKEAIEQSSSQTLPKFKIFEAELTQQINSLSERIVNLDVTKSQLSPDLLQEKNELSARQTLTLCESLIKNEIERKLKLALYDSCIKDTKTNNITRKSSAVTKEIVSKKLKESFLGELKSLSFDHVEVELREAGGERGAMYHKLVLSRAPGVEVPKVASEGESRCLSLASFFAELSTADDPSAILFDDPVSSLDHKWRTRIARRLVQESKERQVIVFTHDLVFLLELHSNAEELSLPIHSLHLKREGAGAGIVNSDLPWKAMKVNDRLKVLNSEMQDATKQYKDGNYTAYEVMAISIYGKLRETWERAFEEVLLDRTVERYRREIQTRQISSLADITQEDCNVFEKGMTVSSKWLRGHDLARAENEDIPKPDELGKDVDSLKNWVKSIRERRKQ